MRVALANAHRQCVSFLILLMPLLPHLLNVSTTLTRCAVLQNIQLVLSLIDLHLKYEAFGNHFDFSYALHDNTL